MKHTSLVVALLLFGVTTSAAGWFKSSGNPEVAPIYKANRVAELNLVSYEDELIDCSALAGIHSWIGDNLDDSGAEVRKALNSNYWIDVSKAYLALAQQAAGVPDLSKEMGVRMRALAGEYRDLTESPTDSQAEAANWDHWYDLIDRCDSWRPDRPSQAFFNNGRETAPQVNKATEVARAPF
ncbi:MAG TPA: hypothetical protein VFG52_08955 [Xanthomonadales bacterium]|nr:hypothetical protein [Xanthomonadales bacterium]